MSFRYVRENEWLIETTTKAQSEKYQNLNTISGIEVSVTKHDMLNSIQGTVVLPQFIDGDEVPDKYLLLESLKKRYNNIQDIEIFQIKPKKNP